MTKKILFWFSADFTFYSISYYLQNKSDYEFYAIVDLTNKPKKFFQIQKLVDFKKVWYFHDHIDVNSDLDEKYLQKIEEKYDLDLWKLALNDRILYGFFDFHKFSRNEIQLILQQSLILFEEILESIKPDFLICAAPYLVHQELLYEICKKKNVQCLLLSMPKLGNKTLISKTVHKFDNIEKLDITEFTNRNTEEILDYIKKSSPTSVIQKYIKNYSNSKSKFMNSALQYMKNSNSHEKTHFTYFGRKKIKVLIYTIKQSLKKRLRETFMKNNLTTIKPVNPYVYYPMAVDMERNVLIDAPFYTNQIEMIKIIAKSLPINYSLVVKENPSQVTRDWRSISDYKEIMNIPNVQLIHPSVSGIELIKNSALVISLAGSSPLEATFHKKPSIVFGDVIYSLIPNIVKVNEISNLPTIIKNSLNMEIDYSYLNKFLDLIDKNTATFDMFEFQTIFNKIFYLDGSYFDVELNEKEIEKLLRNTEGIFEELIQLYVKKINN